jgi:hypothetical protein
MPSPSPAPPPPPPPPPAPQHAAPQEDEFAAFCVPDPFSQHPSQDFAFNMLEVDPPVGGFAPLTDADGVPPLHPASGASPPFFGMAAGSSPGLLLVDSGASVILLRDTRRFVSLRPFRTVIRLAKGTDSGLVRGSGYAVIFPGRPPPSRPLCPDGLF